MRLPTTQCVTSLLLVLEDALDCCIVPCALVCEPVIDIVANLGLSGEAIDAFLAVVVEMGDGVEDVVALRKTRAGGNWLTGGIAMVSYWQ